MLNLEMIMTKYLIAASVLLMTSSGAYAAAPAIADCCAALAACCHAALGCCG
ncbi:MAG TPA: hypothetical protein VNJ05_07270 [Sphingomicrobium sp.]|nr:hypothetical protein [Sphingomicrobium sp.]